MAKMTGGGGGGGSCLDGYTTTVEEEEAGERERGNTTSRGGALGKPDILYTYVHTHMAHSARVTWRMPCITPSSVSILRQQYYIAIKCTESLAKGGAFCTHAHFFCILLYYL